MSEDYTQGQPFPAVAGFGTQGAAAELQSVLDRVKEERLRLLRLLKDCETRFGTTGVVPPAEEIARLTGKVRAIDDAVRNRYDQLRHDETILEKRAYQVDQIREGVQELAEQLNHQINKVRDYKPELTAAKQDMQHLMEQVVAEARSQINLLGDNVADRIGEYRHAQASGQEQLREARREIEKTFADIDQRLAAAAGLARDEAQKLIDPIFGQLENHATDCGQRIQHMIEAADNIVREKLEALPAEAQETLGPARETLDAVIADAREQIATVNDAIKSLDDRLNGLADQAEGIVEQQLDSVASRAGHAMDEVFDHKLRAQEERLARRLEEQQAAFQQREQEMDKKLNDLFMQKQAEMIVALDEQAEGLLDRLKTKHEEKFEALITERIDSVMKAAEDRAHDLSQQIHGQMTASLDQSHAEALAANRKIEDEAEQIARKADEKARTVARAIEDSMREHVVEAMSRADAITDPFKARLEDALATHRAEAEEYSKNAEDELTAKAKAHWDAFRNDTQAALDKQKQALESQAKDTIESTQQDMKARVQELCLSSQSMVDLIEQQLSRKLKAVEPQAQQAMGSIEKQTTERLAQMRDNAEQMVKLTEDQLGRRIADLSPKAISAARVAEQELNEHLARVRQEVENILVPLRRQAIEELGQIAEVGKNLRSSTRRDPAQEVGSTEPPVVNASKLANPLNEMANRMGKKAAKLVTTRNENEPIPGQKPAEAQSDDDRQAA